VKTLKEFIAYATNNPDKLSHSSAGNGTISHLAMEDLKARAGLKILHVPYQGSPRAMTDLVAGTVQVGIDTLAVTKPLVKAGRLRMLAVGTKQRLPDFPDVPTIAESGFTDFEAVAWIGLAAPSGTPRVLRERMQAEVAKTLQDPSMGLRLADLGAVPRPSSIDEFGVFLRSEQRRWKDVVTRSGVKVD
jgi:tripartite-type tricarboxylate transporter receptor subunit TctC